ncbi:MarR family transcriptional regulator [Marasmitruncus massiliensis]|uniref:MarR family transcriptional regulator n=1 Tax=Marasmitruncus massiliensis TaxID=1944642 RepID=UPI000C79A156|nr:helix-turn-helix domain-containing protein [Marasmitruncus massiliensis]
MKKISNPLTIIGIFAGIAEVAGTAVLPLVSSELQRIFIWYVMGFPVLLVVIFFLTLNRNHKVLYAPSDFSNEDNFMQLLSAAKVDKKIEEVKLNNPNIADELESIQLSLLNNISVNNSQKYDKFIKVIQIMSVKNNGVTASELADELAISRAYAHRILQELLENGLITYINETLPNGETSRKIKRYVVLDKGDI